MTWLRLAENCDRIEHPDRLGGWLTTTAYRECLRILRPTRQTAEPVDGLADTLPDPAAGPERTVLDAETAAVVRGLVAELPPRSRTIIQAMFTGETRPLRGDLPTHPAFRSAASGPPAPAPCTSCAACSPSADWNTRPDRCPSPGRSGPGHPGSVIRARAGSGPVAGPPGSAGR